MRGVADYDKEPPENHQFIAEHGDRQLQEAD
jgi:hypothetical protein